MNTVEKIKKLFCKSNVTVSSKVDDKILGDTLSAFEKSMNTNSADYRPNIWRIIMESKMTKFAAAALIILAAFWVVNYFGSSLQVTSVALGEVLEKMSEVPFMRTVTTEIHGDSIRKLIHWHNFRENKTFTEYDKAIWCWDQNTNKQYMYRFLDKLLIISKLPEKGFYGSDSAYSLMRDFIEYSKSEQDTIRSTKEWINGIKAEVFTVKKEYGEDTPMFMDDQPVFAIERVLAIDQKTLLLIEAKAEYLDKNGQVITFSKVEVTYPQDGPSQIYDLGVPKSAKVVNNLPAEDVSEILESYRCHRESAPSIYIAVVQETRFHSKDNTPNFHGASIVYKNGVKQRVDEFGIPTFQRNMGWSEYLIAISTEMGNTFDSQLAWWERNGSLSHVELYDGKFQYESNKDKDNWVHKPKQYSHGGDLRGDNDLADLGWGGHFVSPYQGCGPFTIIEDDYSLENDLICMETKAQGWISDNGWAVLPTRIVTYLNPQRDYICQRYEKHDMFDAPWQEDKSWLDKIEKGKISKEQIEIREVTEFAQTAEGKWYPRIIEHHNEYRANNGSSGTDVRSETIYFKTNPQFHEDIFNPETLPKSE